MVQAPPGGSGGFGEFKDRFRQTPDGDWRLDRGPIYYASGSRRPPVRTGPRDNPRRGPVKPPSRSSGGGGWSANLSGSDRNAADALISLFESFGLGTLASQIVNMVKQGWGSDTIMLKLQSTKEWKKRFAGNEARIKAGLPVLNPAEYLSTERAYRQVLDEYGFPKGFYDSTSDFEKFIGNDLSPSELQQRAQAVSGYINTRDSSALTAMRKLYGLGTGDLAALALDPDRALPLLRKQMQAVGIAAEAQRAGLSYTQGGSEYYADIGITAEQARQGYSTIAEYLPTLNELGDIYGQNYGQGVFEAEVFQGDATATRRRKGLASQQRADFSGQSKGSVGSSSSGY